MLKTASLPNRIKDFTSASVERGAALEDLRTYDDGVLHQPGGQISTASRRFRKPRETALRSIGCSASRHRSDRHRRASSRSPTDDHRLRFWPRLHDGHGDVAAPARKVIFLRDYFDPLGSLMQPLPPANWLYRKVFGVLVA